MNNWRLPIIGELKTLLDLPKAAYEFAFGPRASAFWSGSPNAGYSTLAWSVNFSYGNANHYCDKDYTIAVRLVREAEGKPTKVRIGAKTLTDVTGLEWQREIAAKEITWYEAMEKWGEK